MGSLSVFTHRGLVHWQGLLLAVSLINFWCLTIAVQPAIMSRIAEVGQDVHLRIRNLPPNISDITWYRGKGENNNHMIAFLTTFPGGYIKSPPNKHVTINADGSLLIKYVTKNDKGWYTVVVQLENSNKFIGWGRLNVYETVRVPILLASNTEVTENKDAVELTCYTNAIFNQWLFNGKEVKPSERIKFSHAHGTLTINPIRREDAGIYQCKVSNPISSAASAPLKLNVKFD